MSVETTASYSVDLKAGQMVVDLAGSWVAPTVETRVVHWAGAMAGKKADSTVASLVETKGGRLVDCLVATKVDKLA